MNVHRHFIDNVPKLENDKCLSVGEWTIIYHMRQYYSPVKKNKVWIHATGGLNHDITMLSENNADTEGCVVYDSFLWNRQIYRNRKVISDFQKLVEQERKDCS